VPSLSAVGIFETKSFASLPLTSIFHSPDKMNLLELCILKFSEFGFSKIKEHIVPLAEKI
jgi:hypothetical protein